MKAKHIKYISKFVNTYHENAIHKAPMSSAVQERRFLWRKFDGEGAGSTELSKCNVTENIVWGENRWTCGRTWLNSCFFWGSFLYVLVISVSFSYYFEHPSYSQEGRKCRKPHVEVSKIGTCCIYHFIKSTITVQHNSYGLTFWSFIGLFALLYITMYKLLKCITVLLLLFKKN